MTHETIRSIFDTIVNDWAKVNNIPVAFQNVPFSPPAEQIYLKLYTLPASTSSNDLEGKLRTYLGIYQISVVGIAGRGTGDITAISQKLIPLFPLYETFTKNDFQVQVISPVVEAKPIQTDTTYTLPISFNYRADIFL